MRIAVLLISLACLAQTPMPRTPGAGLGPPKTVRLKALTPAESRPKRAGAGEPQLVGVHRPVPKEGLNKGRWTKLKDGGELWRLAIHSPAAAAIRLHFRKFDVGAGKVWIRSATAKPEVHGPYSGRGLYNDGDFWSDTIFADTVVIEHLTASGRAAAFEIPEISHLLSSNQLPAR